LGDHTNMQHSLSSGATSEYRGVHRVEPFPMISNTPIDHRQSDWLSNSSVEVRMSLAKEICHEVSEQIDSKLAGAFGDVWQQGLEATEKIIEEGREHMQVIAKDLSECHKKNSFMEAQSAEILESLAHFQGHLEELVASREAHRNPDTSGGYFSTADTHAHTARAMQESDPSEASLARQCVHPVNNLVACSSSCSCDFGKEIDLPDKIRPSLQHLQLQSKLPEVPEFPFPAEPLQGQMDSRQLNASDVDAYIFNVTLSHVAGTNCGLHLLPASRGRTLQVDKVLPASAAADWNELCRIAGTSEEAIQPGDEIVSVNDIVGESDTMWHKCKCEAVLHLMIVRSHKPEGLPDSASTPCKASMYQTSLTSFGHDAIAGKADSLVNTAIDGDCRAKMKVAARPHARAAVWQV